MKNLTLTIYLLLIVCSAYSQSYVPFPTQDSTVWRVNFFNCDGPYNCTGHEEFDFILGDTILDGQLYNILYNNHGGLYWETQAYQLQGFVREEDKRVYFIGLDNYADTLTHEVLLYDFNLSVGDTMYWDNNVISYLDNVPYAVLYEIDSVQVTNGEYRRRFSFNSFSPSPVHIIEGIGSNYGPLRPNYLTFESVYSLLCFTDTGTLIYDAPLDSRNYTDADACLYNPVSTETPLSSDLIIFPNPTYDILYFSKNITETVLEIYTPLGTKVYETQTFTGRELDISQLVSGMYFIVLGSTQKTTIKVVKN